MDGQRYDWLRMTISDFLAGKKILCKVDSPFNGELLVVRDFLWGTYIMGGGLTQSGGVAYEVWENSLSRAKSIKKELNSVLIVGLGGGSIANIVRKNWGKDLKIVGVDIDPVIVSLGEKYLKTKSDQVIVNIGDAEDFVKKEKNKYDLICIDTYQMDEFPKKFESQNFINNIKEILNKNGIIIFNRLYYNEKRQIADDFYHNVLQKNFLKIKIVYPQANIMYICEV